MIRGNFEQPVTNWLTAFGRWGWNEGANESFAYETEMIQRYDTHFFVGTVHRYPATWIIVGLFYPARPKDAAQGLLGFSPA